LRLTSKGQPRKLIVFDMDRTLINVSDRHIKAYRTALWRVYGIEGEPNLHKHPGHTQPDIIRMICRDRGVSPDLIEAGLTEAVKVLSDTTIALLDHDLRSTILAGVKDLLEALATRHHVLALVTGTVSRTTRVILERTGLQCYFPICACGDERDQRVELLRLVIERAAGVYCLELRHNDLVVIGDAPHDIEAGKALDAWVVAVATGHHTMDVLAKYKPDVVLPDFKDCQRALDAILVVRHDWISQLAQNRVS